MGVIDFLNHGPGEAGEVGQFASQDGLAEVHVGQLSGVHGEVPSKRVRQGRHW
jgi:hypothetical protein